MSPIEAMIRKADLQCTVCKTPASKGCSCWERCSCGWSALRGFRCGNPNTKRCSTKAKYKRQCTNEEYWHATETGEIKELP
jgi:hypothetical protein